MRAGPKHPIYNVHPNQIAEIQKALGFKTQKDLEDAIDVLDTWVKQQNHFTVREFDRDYLEAYIITAKGSMEKAKYRLDKRCTFRNLMPEMFTNFNINTDFIALFKYYQYSAMPVSTKDFYRVQINKLRNDDGNIQHFNLLDMARYFNVVAEYNMLNEYVYGFEAIVDLTEISLTDILSKLNLVVIRKVMLMVQDGYGCRIKAIHLIYDSKLIETIVAILKQGLSEKLGNRIQIHNNHKNLHNFIDKECLPSDYGGTGPSIQEAHDNIYKELSKDEHVARMKVVDKYATDEAKRLSGKYNEDYMGMPGSFRTLSVD